MCVHVCVWGGWGGCVCKYFKERISLLKKKMVRETQAVLHIDGVKSQEHGNFSHENMGTFHITDFLSLPPICGPSLKARLPNKPALAGSVWVRNQALPGNHSQVMTWLLQAGPGDEPPALPTYQNQVTTPP